MTVIDYTDKTPLRDLAVELKRQMKTKRDMVADTRRWGYVNAFTQTARDHEDADRRTELEVLAGKLTSDPDWAEKAALVAA